MELLKAQAITPEIVEFINEKIAEGQGIEEIVMHEFNQKKVTKRVADKAQSIEKMITDLGYVLKENGYELQPKEEVIIEEFKEEVQQEEGDIVEEFKEETQQKEESKPKKTYSTKKKKAELEAEKQRKLEEELRENPFYLVHKYDLLSKVDQVATDMVEEGTKSLGVYVNEEAEKAFEELQKRFYYIPNYLLISASISFTCKYLYEFTNSKWGNEFIENAFKVEKNRRDFRKKETLRMIEFVQQKLEQIDLESEEGINSRKHLKELRKDLESQKKRKQTNVKTSKFVAETALVLVQDKFPFLSKSDVVNLCIYCFSNCMTINLKPSNND